MLFYISMQFWNVSQIEKKYEGIKNKQMEVDLCA